MLKALDLLLAVCFTITATHAAAASAKAQQLVQNLECNVIEQRISHGLVLKVQFVNSATTPTRLSPEPHVALYRDSQANLQMGVTVLAVTFRVEEVVVPATGSAVSEYRVDAGLLEALRCNDSMPLAAALIFRDQRGSPSERCVLRGFSDVLIPMNTECPGGTPLTPEGKRQ